MCAEVAVKRRGRPPLVVGGTCRRGHVIASEADLIRGKSRGKAYATCRECVKNHERDVAQGLVQRKPYRLTTHFRCGHERTLENATPQLTCRTCHNARAWLAYETSQDVKERQEAQRQRRQAIVAAWLAGATLSSVEQQYHVSRQRIATIVTEEGGVTIRVLRPDLVAFLGQYAVVRNGGGV